MKIIKTELEGVVIIEPRVFVDSRGYFFESFSHKEFAEKVADTQFVQDNESCSTYGVVRGLHYQRAPFAQAKLVRAVEGVILDVAVDIRKDSPTFGKHVAVELSDENKRQLFIPHGFAHGLVVMSPTAIVSYKCDNYYNPESEGSVLWNDPQLEIDWRVPLEDVVLSEKDGESPLLGEIMVNG